jgi:hypothetical protein
MDGMEHAVLPVAFAACLAAQCAAVEPCAPGRFPAFDLTLRNDSWGPIDAARCDDGRTHQTTVAARVGRFSIGLEHSILTRFDSTGYANFSPDGQYHGPMVNQTPGERVRWGDRIDEATVTVGWLLRSDDATQIEAGAGWRWRGDLGGERGQNALHRVLRECEWRGTYESAPAVAVGYALARHRAGGPAGYLEATTAVEVTSDPVAAIDASLVVGRSWRWCEAWAGVRGQARIGDQASPVLSYVAERDTTAAVLVGGRRGVFAWSLEADRFGVITTALSLSWRP